MFFRFAAASCGRSIVMGMEHVGDENDSGTTRRGKPDACSGMAIQSLVRRMIPCPHFWREVAVLFTWIRGMAFGQRNGCVFYGTVPNVEFLLDGLRRRRIFISEWRVSTSNWRVRFTVCANSASGLVVIVFFSLRSRVLRSSYIQHGDVMEHVLADENDSVPAFLGRGCGVVHMDPWDGIWTAEWLRSWNRSESMLNFKQPTENGTRMAHPGAFMCLTTAAFFWPRGLLLAGHFHLHIGRPSASSGVAAPQFLHISACCRRNSPFRLISFCNRLRVYLKTGVRTLRLALVVVFSLRGRALRSSDIDDRDGGYRRRK